MSKKFQFDDDDDEDDKLDKELKEVLSRNPNTTADMNDEEYATKLSVSAQKLQSALN